MCGSLADSWYLNPFKWPLNLFVMELSFIEIMFDFIGKLFFPRQQDWERRRNAKIMTAAVTLGIVLGVLVIMLLKHMNGIRK